MEFNEIIKAFTKMETDNYANKKEFPEFHETERGNTWLMQEEEGYHQVFIPLNEEKTRWLSLSILPCNYPGLNIDTVNQTEEQIAKDIMETNEGWLVQRLNILGVKTYQESPSRVYIGSID